MHPKIRLLLIISLVVAATSFGLVLLWSLRVRAVAFTATSLNRLLPNDSSESLAMAETSVATGFTIGLLFGLVLAIGLFGVATVIGKARDRSKVSDTEKAD
jgi:hypothetical protein